MQPTRWLDKVLPRGAALGLPSLCAVCHGWGVQRLCDACVGRFVGVVWRCRRCGLEVADGIEVCGACVVTPPPYDSTLAAVTYGYPWDRLIAAFKFHAALDLVPVFADRLVAARRRSEAPMPSLLVPVPLSQERLRERGYNQAWELARRLARTLPCSADSALLLRVRDAPHQLAFPPDRRAANVRGAFAVEPRRLAELRGRHITVVDDVMTTGATAAEVARILHGAGAARVDIWVVARTPRPTDAV
ncbi:MAG: ComF family protein [Pseudomonadota bacterium]|nr:ComF family protein [Pseudomonadota bacterium]